MNNTIYFHTNYTSSRCDYYTKVSVEMQGKGVFCVVCNKKDGSLMHQKYAWDTSYSKNARRYIGLTREGLYIDLNMLASNWSKIGDKEKIELLSCVRGLPYAFTRFFRSNAGVLTKDEAREVENLCDNVVKTVVGFANGNASAENATADYKAEVVEEKWSQVGLETLTKNDLTAIITKIQENGNPAEGVEYNGKRYAVVNDNGMMMLKVRETVKTVAKAEETAKAEPAKPTAPSRKSVNMAFMVDNANLTEFVNGCFYKIVACPHSGYVGLLNDKGEERFVKSERVNIVSVFTEPPQGVNADQTKEAVCEEK